MHTAFSKTVSGASICALEFVTITELPAVVSGIRSSSWKQAVNSVVAWIIACGMAAHLVASLSRCGHSSFEVEFPFGWGYDVAMGHRRPRCWEKSGMIARDMVLVLFPSGVFQRTEGRRFWYPPSGNKKHMSLRRLMCVFKVVVWLTRLVTPVSPGTKRPCESN